MAKTTTNAQRHINKLMSVLRQGKPVSVLTITYEAALSETDVEFALATLMQHKIVTATPGGRKYGLVSGYAGKLEVLLNSMKPAPEKPKARAPKAKPKVVVNELTNTDKVMNCLSDGEEWAFGDIVETTGAKTGSVAGLLTTLCKTGQVKKVRRAVYRLPTDDEDDEEPEPEPDPEPKPATNNERMSSPHERHRRTCTTLPCLSSRVLRVFEDERKVWTAPDIAQKLGVDRKKVNSCINYLLKEERIQKVCHGHYTIKGAPIPEEFSQENISKPRGFARLFKSLVELVTENTTQIAEIKKTTERIAQMGADKRLHDHYISRGILDKGIKLSHDEPFIYIDVMGVEHTAHIEEEEGLPLIVYSEEK